MQHLVFVVSIGLGLCVGRWAPLRESTTGQHGGAQKNSVQSGSRKLDLRDWTLRVYGCKITAPTPLPHYPLSGIMGRQRTARCPPHIPPSPPKEGYGAAWRMADADLRCGMLLHVPPIAAARSKTFRGACHLPLTRPLERPLPSHTEGLVAARPKAFKAHPEGGMP